MKSLFQATLAIALAGSLGIAGPVWAEVKGTAEVGITKPVTKVDGKDVVTTMKLKNLSKTSITGLKVEEYWYDKAGNASPGDSRQFRQPIAPGAVISIELRTPKTATMDRNSYQFSHSGGKVTTQVLAKVE